MTELEIPVKPEIPPAPKTPALMERKYFWGALAIISMWLAVLFVGVFADADFVASDPSGSEVQVPVVWGIALFAFLASWVVGFFAFRERKA